MSADQANGVAVPPPVPPTQPGGRAQPKGQPAWAMVIGVLAIVFGVLGVLGGGCGVVGPFASSAIMSLAQDPQMDAILAAQETWKVWNVIHSILGMGVAVVLLVAGIGLLKRHSWSPKACVTWSIVKMVVVVVGAVLGYAQRPSFETMMQQGPAMGGMESAIITGLTGIAAAVQVLWGLALPVFVLIWFSRSKIKAEVAGWS